MACLFVTVLFSCVSLKDAHDNKIVTLYPLSSLENGALAESRKLRCTFLLLLFAFALVFFYYKILKYHKNNNLVQ